MALQEILGELGLHKKESLVYLASLQLINATASEIAQLTNIQRTHVYDISKKLVEKGFFRQTRKGNKQLYFAILPEEILNIQNKKIERFKKAIPEIEAMTNSLKQKPKIFYYEGEEGMRKISDEVTKSEGELLVFSDEDFFTKDDGIYQKIYIQKRLDLHTTCRAIAGISSAAIKSQQSDKEELRETRLLPKELFESKVLFGMLNHKTYVINHQKNFGFIIEDKDFTETLEMIFELIWNSGKIISK